MEDIEMIKKKIKVIDGIKYYSDRPDRCRDCKFWKNRVVGCTLGKDNCYYLAEEVMTEQEKKCQSCCYARNAPCVTACCYKDLMKWFNDKRGKAGEGNE